MQINKLVNTGNINYTKAVNTNPIKHKDKQLDCDIFEKSSDVSFKGGFFDSLFEDVFSNLIDGIASVLQHHKREIQVGTFVDALSDKSLKQWFQFNKTTKIQSIIEDLYGDSDFLETDFMVKLFEKAGINNGSALGRFIQLYSSRSETRKVFKNQEMEAVEIFGMLKSKDDLAKYSELLLYLYNYNHDSSDQNQIDINSILEFLKKLNIHDFKDFDSRFAHLKGSFNNFDTIADKVDSIMYLQETYDAKIRYINEIIQNNSGLKNKHPEKIYNAQTDIIDYLYEKNNGESLEPLSLIIDSVSSIDKAKSSILKNISGYFNSFETPEDKIDFHMFLRNNKADVGDLNALTGAYVISDYEKVDGILNKEQFVREISSLIGGKIDAANLIYRNFSDLFNAIYKQGKGDISDIKKVLDIIQLFNLKNSSAMMNLYNSICVSNKKSISSEEFEEFVNLMTFCSSKDIVKQAKSLKTTPRAILEQERKNYLAVQDKIEAFILSDESDYFTGKTTEEIYMEYKDSINASDDVSSVLQNIVRFNIASHEEYSKKTEKVAQLEQYFKDKKSFLEFVNANNIKFDFSPEDEDNINNCIKLFSSLTTPKQIAYYTRTPFVQNSQNVLDKFFKVHSDEECKKEILSVIADKRIPSLNFFNSFMRKYASEDGDYQNVLKQLSQLPDDIDFEKYSAILKLIQGKLDRLNIPIKINNDNISQIDIELFKDKNKVSVQDLTCLLNKLLKAQDGYIFVSSLPNAVRNDEKEYSRFQIAVEFVHKFGKTDESYSNINNKLGLDRKLLGLKEDCSDYLYIRAIEQALPDEFVDFVNSNNWVSEDKEHIPNLSLHARLRLIDRFGLSNGGDISELYTNETQKRLIDILNTVYTQTPESIKGSDQTKRIIIDTNYNGKTIETVFAQNGKMITIVPKSS